MTEARWANASASSTWEGAPSGRKARRASSGSSETMVSGARRSTGGGTWRRLRCLGGVASVLGSTGSACSGWGVKQDKALGSGWEEAENWAAEKWGVQLKWDEIVLVKSRSTVKINVLNSNNDDVVLITSITWYSWRLHAPSLTLWWSDSSQ